MFHRQKSEQEDAPSQQSPTQGTDMAQQNTDQKAEQSQQPDRSIGIPGSSMARSAQPASRMPYQGYGTSAYNPAQQGPTATTGDNGRKLIVGRGISMSGEIESCDHLIVEGKVEAALKGAKLLEISEAGTFFGTVEIDEATVAGSFEGDLTVTGRLTIKSGGSITGAITYGELAVEAGANVDGKLSPLKSAEEARRSPSKPKKEEAQVQSYQQQSQRVANEQEQGGELFTEQKTAAQ